MKEHVFEAYVTNLGKYNEGDLVGEWVQFPTTAEKLQSVLDRIGINKEYEEYFITEYNSEVVNGLHNHLGEYEQVADLNYLARRIQEMDSGELEQFNAVMGNNIYVAQEGAIGCINLTYNLDKYNYYPDVTTEEELGIYLIEELKMFDVNSMGKFSYYFDYDAYGRDTCINDGGTFLKEGYINKIDTEWDYEYDGNPKSIPDEYRMKTANKQLEDLAKNIHQHISDFGKSEVSYSVDTILKDLETGNIKDLRIYNDILEEYAEDLYVDGAESTAYASVGAIGRDEADKSVDKYNEVMRTCTRLQEFSEKLFSVHESQLEYALGKAIDEAIAAAEVPEPDFEMEL